VLTTCQPSTVWCSRERLPAAAAQPAKVRQSCSATDLFIYVVILIFVCCCDKLFNKSVSFSTTLNFPVIVDRQFYSYTHNPKSNNRNISKHNDGSFKKSLPV
jgi:hypothetical protein